MLQNNGWVWELAGVRVLVDPWLVGELDFDIPAFYSAKKRVTGNMTVSSAVPCLQEFARMHSHHRSFFRAGVGGQFIVGRQEEGWFSNTGPSHSLQTSHVCVLMCLRISFDSAKAYSNTGVLIVHPDPFSLDIPHVPTPLQRRLEPCLWWPNAGMPGPCPPDWYRPRVAGGCRWTACPPWTRCSSPSPWTTTAT